jgi:hypothetical protein
LLAVADVEQFLKTGIESLVSLEHIIRTKYSAVLKVENGRVHGVDGIKEFLAKQKDFGRASHSKDRSTISMTITINNVDQELCGHFLWDLAHKAIRDKFHFSFDGDASNALHSSSQSTIAVDEFEAHHTIVTRAFEYLTALPIEQSDAIGGYLIAWLPYHLNCLRELEDEERGYLTPNQQLELGQNLYDLFKDEVIFKRHKNRFESTIWWATEMWDMSKWFRDSAVVRRQSKVWRDAMQLAESPVEGYLKTFVTIVVRGFLRERSWDVRWAMMWIEQFLKVVGGSTSIEMAKL